jgi:hypothetical protein
MSSTLTRHGNVSSAAVAPKNVGESADVATWRVTLRVECGDRPG